MPPLVIIPDCVMHKVAHRLLQKSNVTFGLKGAFRHSELENDILFDRNRPMSADDSFNKRVQVHIRQTDLTPTRSQFGCHIQVGDVQGSVILPRPQPVPLGNDLLSANTSRSDARWPCNTERGTIKSWVVFAT